jgi:hypothetical protein
MSIIATIDTTDFPEVTHRATGKTAKVVEIFLICGFYLYEVHFLGQYRTECHWESELIIGEEVEAKKRATAAPQEQKRHDPRKKANI